MQEERKEVWKKQRKRKGEEGRKEGTVKTDGFNMTQEDDTRVKGLLDTEIPQHCST